MQQTEAIERLKELASRRKLGHFARWSGVNYHTLSDIARQRGRGDKRGISEANMAKIARGFDRLGRHGELFAFQSKRDLPTILAIEVDEWSPIIDYYCAMNDGRPVVVYTNGAASRHGGLFSHAVSKDWRTDSAMRSKRVYRQQWQEVRDALGFN